MADRSVLDRDEPKRESPTTRELQPYPGENNTVSAQWIVPDPVPAGPFNAHDTALRIEQDAKKYFDHFMIEDANTTIQHECHDALLREFANFADNPGQMTQVATELEKLGGETFSTLPNVTIGRDGDTPYRFEFTPSRFDFQGWDGHFRFDVLAYDSKVTIN